MWLTGGLENITSEERPKALPLLCLKRERRVFEHVGLQSEGNYSALCLWGSEAVSGESLGNNYSWSGQRGRGQTAARHGGNGASVTAYLKDNLLEQHGYSLYITVHIIL